MGARGFLGRRIKDKLREAGIGVTGTTRALSEENSGRWIEYEFPKDRIEDRIKDLRFDYVIVAARLGNSKIPFGGAANGRPFPMESAYDRLFSGLNSSGARGAAPANDDQDGFTVGARDRLLRRLAERGLDQLAQFCEVHKMALFAEPTPAMKAIARLVADGKVREVFTDNVDNLLSKTGVQYKRVRGSGVFNERYNGEFSSPRLIVIGVAADRRQVIRQARSCGVNVVVVNPCKKVSPNVMHLEYVRNDDLFFKCDADHFFGEVMGGRYAPTGHNRIGVLPVSLASRSKRPWA
jgi:hypothetical protein